MEKIGNNIWQQDYDNVTIVVDEVFNRIIVSAGDGVKETYNFEETPTIYDLENIRKIWNV